MKKALISVLRLVMFVGVLALLPFKGPDAQIGASQCVTFNTENDPCPTCCTNSTTDIMNVVVAVSSSTGIQSIVNTPLPCGAAKPGGCDVTCTGDTYPEAANDSNCCIPAGSPSANNEPCCTGLIARSNGTCGACSTTGGTCGTNSDCCGSVICDGGTCLAPGCNQKDPWCTGNSPVIIDVGGEGFSLTSAAGGVVFDISGTGHPIQIAWTASGADNAFLALPGADGLVHDGKQLFGNFTPQPPSPDPNGFLALAVYDLPANGGNGDGIIDSRDAIYPHLRLWIDANHDGVSQPGELHTLPSLGVVSISLHDTLSRRVDQYGNVFRYKAGVDVGDADPTHVGRTAYDVFFVSLQQQPPKT